MIAQIEIATWNVLHRIHAENWGEAQAQAFPLEAVRTTAIATRVAKELASRCEAVCLQEVSGDQLAMLRMALPGAFFYELRYPRVPKLKSGAESPLVEATEHLVTIAARGSERLAAAAFASDPGKGFLSVALPSGFVVVNTHVSFGPRAQKQIDEVVVHAKTHTGQVVIAGDFNASAADASALLGPEFTIVPLRQPALPTRPRAPGHEKSSTIDHAFVWRAAPVDAEVLDGEGLSDHNPVVAGVQYSQ